MDVLPLAELFQALADPSRLRILALLSRMELSVGELAQLLGQSQPRVSRHVRILADAGIVERRKEGSWVFLALSDPDRTAPLLGLIDCWADSQSKTTFHRDTARLDAIRADRAEAAGVRSSLRQGDIYALPLGDCSADSIIIHQVLHYAHAPANAIAEAARVLAPGGTLLVVDFAAHDREDLRVRDAHLRLGFADDVMSGWFHSAGLEMDHVEHLKGGELTVTIWRGSKLQARKRKAA
jgi:DNA-binding transcriptional ArsR family regulator